MICEECKKKDKRFWLFYFAVLVVVIVTMRITITEVREETEKRVMEEVNKKFRLVVK